MTRKHYRDLARDIRRIKMKAATPEARASVAGCINAVVMALKQDNKLFSESTFRRACDWPD